MTNVPGCYIIGDVSGTPLIKNAANEKDAISAVEEIALLEQADQALYQAKRGGRNGYALYTLNSEPKPDNTSGAPGPVPGGRKEVDLAD